MSDKNITKEIRDRLSYEFTHHKSGGVYQTLQIMMAYNSNRIEGSTLTEKQASLLFETGTVSPEGDILFRAKDVEEMTGHFRMFNNVIKSLNEPLSEDLIKTMHYDLKTGVFEDMANGYPCGEYKNRANRVGDVVTALPKDVPERMNELVSSYLSKDNITLTDLAEFHTKYETIHPFQDGNGRTGRMILFRECLRNDIAPVIILDDHKAEYYKSLDLARNEGYDKLASFFEKEQKIVLDKIKDLVIDYQVSERDLNEIISDKASSRKIQELVKTLELTTEENQNTLILASGLPGSGKTDACEKRIKEIACDKERLDITEIMPISFLPIDAIYDIDKEKIKKVFENTIEETSGVVMISANNTREEVKSLGTSDDRLVFAIVDARIEVALNNGLDVVYDATNLDDRTRNKYLDMADQYGAKTEILLCETSIDKAQKAHPEIREDILENMQERFDLANENLLRWDKVTEIEEIEHEIEYDLEL